MGLINGAQQAQDDQAVAPGAVRAQMKLSPQQAGTYEKIVAAGKKLMYSPQMDDQIQALLSGPGDMGMKLGQGVVGLIGLLMDKSNGTLPPDLIIPASLELVAEAADMLRATGQKVTKEDVGEGMGVVVEEILKRAGVSLDQVPQLLQGQAQGAPAEPGESPAEQAAETPEDEAAESPEEQAEEQEPPEPQAPRRGVMR